MAENFDLIFGQSASQQYGWSDSDYQNGWGTVGSTPPTAGQFDALQRRSDTKSKELNDRLTPIETNNTNIFRQPSTAYALKDIRFYPELPAGWYLECSVAGITDSGAITLPSPVVENATVIDGTVTWKIRKISSADGVPLGIILPYSSNGDIPSGYLLCDGSAVSRTMFPDLFAAIGTTYGAGDGSTTFNVPDYNTAQRFAQGSTVAGVEKEAGLPNITGTLEADSYNFRAVAMSGNGAFSNNLPVTINAVSVTSGTTASNHGVDFDASLSNPIYGNSDTVQPNALTVRYIIKAFDGQTADSALIDITQYANELAGKANITGSNLVHHRDVITTSGTYTAPVTGLYKVTIKGGGGGGGRGLQESVANYGGGGGGEGGTTIAFEKMTVGDTASVVIGAGGESGNAGNSGIGATGGTSSVTISENTYSATGGGGGGNNAIGGTGGTGTIYGCAGGTGSRSTATVQGGEGGGAGGGITSVSASGAAGVYGGGGAGGTASSAAMRAGGAGGDGFAIFEYYTPGA